MAKYKITQEKIFLGHHYGKTPREAISRMLKTSYADFYKINKCGWFDLTDGRNHYHITGEE